MRTDKILKRIPDDDLFIVVSLNGKKYSVKTAKIFNNQTRSGPSSYFGIVVDEQISELGELMR